MAARDIVVVGAGGSGRETWALIKDIESLKPGTWNLMGFLADDCPDMRILGRLGARYLGSPANRHVLRGLPRSCAYVVGIGSGMTRATLESEMDDAGLENVTVIHPSVWIGPDVEIGKGSVIAAGTVITTNARIGRSAQINLGCTIGHDARWGDHVTLAQGVNIAGNVKLFSCATIFTNASIAPGVAVGRGATVGAGAVVLDDVHDGVTVVGVPARPRAPKRSSPFIM